MVMFSCMTFSIFSLCNYFLFLTIPSSIIRMSKMAKSVILKSKTRKGIISRASSDCCVTHCSRQTEEDFDKNFLGNKKRSSPSPKTKFLQQQQTLFVGEAAKRLAFVTASFLPNKREMIEGRTNKQFIFSFLQSHKPFYHLFSICHSITSWSPNSNCCIFSVFYIFSVCLSYYACLILSVCLIFVRIFCLFV